MKKECLETLLKDVKEKFDLVIEGHASLNKKIDAVYENLHEQIEMNGVKIDALNTKIDDVDARLSKKLDAVASDLAAHRADTESHSKGYKVSE